MHIKYQQLIYSSWGYQEQDKHAKAKDIIISFNNEDPFPHEYQFITFIVLVMSYYTIILIMLPVQ